jgi:formate dehydrogenase
MAWSNSVRYGADDRPTELRLHPDDARVAGVRDGGTATVTTAHGALEVRVVTDGRVRPGVASMVHGRRDQSPGLLLSTRDGVDPLTTMPHSSGVPVTIEPA